MASSLFTGRRLCIATKHGKEQVLEPKFASNFGMTSFVSLEIDTDALGTFTGEVERTLSPLESARKKCQMAFEQTDCDLALASEGSFGNHPTLFFVPADEEFLVLQDRKNKLEIVARHLSTETNFSAASVSTEEELTSFADKVGFPEHGLIVKNAETDWQFLQKGIQEKSELKNAFRKCMELHNQVFVETDMRAMFNPSRMEVIAKTADILIEKMQSCCPNCEMPGFDVVENQPGLPCEQCSLPTKSTLNAVYRCTHCNFAKIEKFPNGKNNEDPMYCDFCNP